MDYITPNGMGGSEEAKKLVGGWKAMQQQKQTGQRVVPPRQQRILQESQQKKPLTEGGYRPGDEEGNGEVSMRKLKESANKMVQKQISQKEFKGSAENCINKLIVLFNGVEDPETGAKRPPTKKPEIINIEESGFGTYKIVYSN